MGILAMAMLLSQQGMGQRLWVVIVQMLSYAGSPDGPAHC